MRRELARNMRKGSELRQEQGRERDDAERRNEKREFEKKLDSSIGTNLVLTTYFSG